MSLTSLPAAVLDDILDFLPQQAVINLALTNFHFYNQCMAKLYRHLNIQGDPVLKNTLGFPKDKVDTSDALKTVVYGFLSPRIDKHHHHQLLAARIRALTQSIGVNSAHAAAILSLTVDEGAHEFSDEIVEAIVELLGVISRVNHNLQSVYVGSFRLRQRLSYRRWARELKLKSVVVDDADQLAEISEISDVSEIIITFKNHRTTEDVNSLPPRKLVLPNVKSLVLPTNVGAYDGVVDFLHRCYFLQPFKIKPTTLTLLHHHSSPKVFYPFVDFSEVQTLRLSLGCAEDSCNHECIDEFLSWLHHQLPSHVRGLYVEQNSPPETNNHVRNERWDIIVLNLVKSVIESQKNHQLSTLCISHSVVKDAVIDDGFEGNYLRRLQLYGHFLPNFLLNRPKKITLMLPNLISSFSVYEQAMNNLMWNGCKCKHCEVFLLKLDTFLIYHKYYNFRLKIYKDLLPINIIRVISEVLKNRMAIDENMGDLNILKNPLKLVNWNFHDNDFSIPFKCLNYKTYEEAEFEDEKDPQDEELYFDAEDKHNDCEFFTKVPFKDIATCMAHYTNDIVLKLINLNRGNAEDIHIGGIDDENDGNVNLQINKLIINGIVYNFDKEPNGTAFFSNAYDETVSRSQ